MCDFAVGLSRQLYGLTIASERPLHRLAEQWHPAGAGGRDHGLQFPRRRLGLERDARPGLRRPVVWKAVGEDAAVRAWPARRSPARVLAEMPDVPRRGVLGLVIGAGPERGAGPGRLAAVPLVSATGSVRDGPRRGPDGRRPAWPIALGTQRQQRHGRGPFRRSGTGRALDRVCRRRHGRASAARRCGG